MPAPIIIEIDGVRDSIRGHAMRRGVSYSTVRARIHRGGMTPEDALTAPVTPGAPGRPPVLTPEERGIIAKRYRQGVGAADLAQRYGISRRHVYRLVAAAEARAAAWFDEPWDDVRYWIPVLDGRPAVYSADDGTGDVLVAVRRDPLSEVRGLPSLILRYSYAAGDWIDAEPCPHVIRAEVAEAVAPLLDAQELLGVDDEPTSVAEAKEPAASRPRRMTGPEPDLVVIDEGSAFTDEMVDEYLRTPEEPPGPRCDLCGAPTYAEDRRCCEACRGLAQHLRPSDDDETLVPMPLCPECGADPEVDDHERGCAKG